MKLTKRERKLLTDAWMLVDVKQRELPETGKCDAEERALLEKLLNAKLNLIEALKLAA